MVATRSARTLIPTCSDAKSLPERPNDRSGTDWRTNVRGMNKVVVVTGANSGIGRAVAVHLASSGYDVYGTVRDVGKAEKLLAMAEAAKTTVQIVKMDIASDESVREAMTALLGRVGGVDVLVNNAGVGGNAVLEECPVSLYADVMNVNVYGAVRCAQAVLPGMRERRSGTIVNITSIAGRLAALASPAMSYR